jgi:hypothetical protein
VHEDVYTMVHYHGPSMGSGWLLRMGHTGKCHRMRCWCPRRSAGRSDARNSGGLSCNHDRVQEDREPSLAFREGWAERRVPWRFSRPLLVILQS